MVGHILRYHPAILKLQELIRDGALGKINYLYSNRLNIGKIRTEENILWSFAPHDISVMLSLLERDAEPRVVPGRRVSESRRRRRHAEPLRFPERRAGAHLRQLAASRQGAAAGGRRLGEDGGLRRHRGRTSSCSTRTRSSGRTGSRPRSRRRAKSSRSTTASRCARSASTSSTASRPRTPPVSDGAEGLRVLRVLDACQRALLNGGVALEPSPTAERPKQPPYFVHESAYVDDGRRGRRRARRSGTSPTS